MYKTFKTFFGRLFCHHKLYYAGGVNTNKEGWTITVKCKNCTFEKKTDLNGYLKLMPK